MTAKVLTEAGSPIPAELMEKWCQMWADGDRRLRADEIAVNVLGGHPERTPGQLWDRLAEPSDSSQDHPGNTGGTQKENA
jgi:hypothetical protein